MSGEEDFDDDFQGLLKEGGLLQRDDDFGGQPVMPSSLVAKSKMVLMKRKTAVPAPDVSANFPRPCRGEMAFIHFFTFLDHLSNVSRLKQVRFISRRRLGMRQGNNI